MNPLVSTLLMWERRFEDARGAHVRQSTGDDTPRLRPPLEFGRLVERLPGNRLRAAVPHIEAHPRDDDCRAEAAEEPLW